MANLQSPFQANPRELAPTTANEGAQDSALDALFSGAQQIAQSPEQQVDPQAAQQTQAQQPQAGSAIDQLFQQPDPTIEQQIPLAVQEPDPGETFDFDSLKARFKASFGVTETEQQQAIQSVFKDSNVFKSGDDWLIQKPNQKPFKLEGEGAADFLADIFADNARTLVEMGVDIGITAGGTAAGIATGGPVGGAVAFGAADALGGVTAINVGDAIQEALGIERDPSRSRVTENIIAGSLGAGFKAMGTGVSKILAKRASKKAAAQALDENLIREEVDEVVESIIRVNDSGFVKEGDQIRLVPTQQAPSNPELKIAAQELSTEREFREFISKQGKMISETYERAGQMLGNVSGPRRGITERFGEAVGDVDTAAGRLIGDFRKSAIDGAGQTPIEMPNMNNTLNKLIDDLDGLEDGLGQAIFKPRQTKQEIAKLTDALVSDGLTDAQARAYLTQTRLMGKQMQKGMSLTSLDAWYDRLGKQINRLGKSDTNSAMQWKLINLRKGLRDDWTKAIGDHVGGPAKPEYEKALKRFSEVRTSLNDLNSALKKEGISQEALVKHIFQAPGENLKRIKAVRTVIQKEDPELWRDMTGEFFVETLRKASDDFGRATQKTNWKKVAKTWNDIGKEAQSEILSGSGMPRQDFRALLNVAQRSQNFTVKDFRHRPETTSVLKSMFLVLSNTLPTTKAQHMGSIVQSMGRDKALANYLAEDGLERMLKFAKPAKRGLWREKIKPVINAALREELREEGAEISAGINESTRPSPNQSNDF